MFHMTDMILELDDGAKIRTTADGYMTAMPRVARTGIQLYRGSEVGMPEKGVVRIFRDENEVFKKDSVSTFVGKPFTDNHPKVPVTSRNWRDYSVGVTGEDVLRDGQHIRIPMVLMDGRTIEKVGAGKTQLSVGYTCDIKWGEGTTPSGETYDGRQTDIIVNHIAIVDAARGGPELCIGDGDTKYQALLERLLKIEDGNPTEKKAMKTLLVDSITCEMSDVAVEVVQRALKNASDAAASQAKKFGESEADYQARIKKTGDELAKVSTESAAKDAKIVTLEAQLKDAKLTPEKIDALVKDRAVVADKAKVMLPTVVVDGKSVEDIRAQVVTARLGDAAKDWDAGQMKVSFDTMAADIDTKDHSGVRDTARAFSAPPAQALLDSEKRYDAYDKRLSEAWKGPAANA